MISEDDQFHHLEERIGPRKRGRPQHLPRGHTWTAVFNFIFSFKQVLLLYIYNLPKFPYAVHFPSLINAESADTRTMAVFLSIPESDLL